MYLIKMYCPKNLLKIVTLNKFYYSLLFPK